MQQLIFVSGLPRSGSTLLVNFLGQNPNHVVTPTSGLIEMFVRIKNEWKKFIEFKAEGLEVAKPKVINSLNGLLHGYFEPHISNGKVAFDKSRGWLQYIEDLEEVLGRKVQIIVTVRDVRAILASFEKIYRNRGIEYDYPLGESFFACQTIEGRCEMLLSPGGVVGIAINRLRDAIARGLKDRLVIVPFLDLLGFPKPVMQSVHQQLGLNPFDYDPDNVVQVTHENDLWHGMDLHTIKNKIQSPTKPAWIGILPEEYANSIAKRYADINELVK